MLVGVPKEIKNHEYRVGMTPLSVGELVHNGHSAVVETQAGSGIGAAAWRRAAQAAAPVPFAEPVVHVERALERGNIEHQCRSACKRGANVAESENSVFVARHDPRIHADAELDAAKLRDRLSQIDLPYGG